MRISGFSYVRNGLDMGYPFVEAIQSILPLCDEIIVAVGDSTDNTRNAVLEIDPKVKVVDTVWDMGIKKGGFVFAQQSNAALDHISGDWAIHIQADEAMHENDHEYIHDQIKKFHNDSRMDGFLQPFLHFWGNYNYIRTSRRVHRNEIRIFKTNKFIRAYRDSQGFRIYNSKVGYENGEKGKKLQVRKLDAPVFHYNAVRSVELMKRKSENFYIHWENGEEKLKKMENEFDYNKVDRLGKFEGSHPKVMEQIIKNSNWDFKYDPSKRVWFKKKDKILQPVEDLLGIRFGEYKNYKLIK